MELSFKSQMKDQENDSRAGYSDGKWYPHGSVEGGSGTIAYGHKIKPGEDFSDGISDSTANQLFESDFQRAYDRAESAFDGIYGSGEFAELDTYKQNVATDIAFNTGNLTNYPKFMKAMYENDLDGMTDECKSYCQGRPLNRRNDWRIEVIESNYEEDEEDE